MTIINGITRDYYAGPNVYFCFFGVFRTLFNTVALLTQSEVGVLIHIKKALITLLIKYNSGDRMSNLTAQLIYEENKLLICIKFLNENYYCFFYNCRKP